MRSNLILIFSALIITIFVSCKKEILIYEVNKTEVNLSSIDKNTLKRQSEFISQAYSDLFEKPINDDLLSETLICYHAFSDYDLVEDMVIRHLIRQAVNKIPERKDIVANVDSFTVVTFKKFYHRSPDVLELWNVKNIIESDTSVSPDMIYYAMMTSDEYKFY